jgi:hypothetical protein
MRCHDKLVVLFDNLLDDETTEKTARDLKTKPYGAVSPKGKEPAHHRKSLKASQHP